MTPGEWRAFARDLNRIVTQGETVIYEHVKADGTLQLYLQPTRPVDVMAALARKRGRKRADA